MNCPNLLVFKSCGGRVLGEAAVMQPADSPVRANPEVSVVVFREHASAEVTKPIAHLIVGKTAAMPSAHPFVGCDPYASIPPLQKGAHEIIYQPVFGRVM